MEVSLHDFILEQDAKSSCNIEDKVVETKPVASKPLVPQAVAEMEIKDSTVASRDTIGTPQVEQLITGVDASEIRNQGLMLQKILAELQEVKAQQKVHDNRRVHELLKPGLRHINAAYEQSAHIFRVGYFTLDAWLEDWSVKNNQKLPDAFSIHTFRRRVANVAKALGITPPQKKYVEGAEGKVNVYTKEDEPFLETTLLSYLQELDSKETIVVNNSN